MEETTVFPHTSSARLDGFFCRSLPVPHDSELCPLVEDSIISALPPCSARASAFPMAFGSSAGRRGSNVVYGIAGAAGAVAVTIAFLVCTLVRRRRAIRGKVLQNSSDEKPVPRQACDRFRRLCNLVYNRKNCSKLQAVSAASDGIDNGDAAVILAASGDLSVAAPSSSQHPLVEVVLETSLQLHGTTSEEKSTAVTARETTTELQMPDEEGSHRTYELAISDEPTVDSQLCKAHTLVSTTSCQATNQSGDMSVASGGGAGGPDADVRLGYHGHADSATGAVNGSLLDGQLEASSPSSRALFARADVSQLQEGSSKSREQSKMSPPAHPLLDALQCATSPPPSSPTAELPTEVAARVPLAPSDSLWRGSWSGVLPPPPPPVGKPPPSSPHEKAPGASGEVSSAPSSSMLWSGSPSAPSPPSLHLMSPPPSSPSVEAPLGISPTSLVGARAALKALQGPRPPIAPLRPPPHPGPVLPSNVLARQPSLLSEAEDGYGSLTPRDAPALPEEGASAATGLAGCESATGAGVREASAEAAGQEGIISGINCCESATPRATAAVASDGAAEGSRKRKHKHKRSGRKNANKPSTSSMDG
eukprot:gnl/TRDRNA2_/TRDRNA2_29257_c0_seq1.p1 gnl/TRDRNA2_/TRDRNA2_29257_c0~~gnl/TRDRNA2_/TRDRNA2_29257_c0_seq1.p1  ORF type:complete len:684 (-),score=80.88 gnl/TRDRNA2_/TRDRNA2_29257_c0_seq1:203-1978(-)